MNSNMTIKRIKDILENEISTLEEYYKYQEDKDKKLKDALNNISKCIDEDKKIVDIARSYITDHDFCSDTKLNAEKIIDDVQEVNSLIQILHAELCNIIKKFVNIYFHEDDEDNANKAANQTLSDACSSSSPSDSCQSVAGSFYTSSPGKSTRKKSFLEILKKLLYYLNPDSLNEEYGIMEVDDTVRCSDIEFLLSVGIVKQSSKYPACIELKKEFLNVTLPF